MKIRQARKEDMPSIIDLWVEFMDFHSDRDPYFNRNAEARHRFEEFMLSNLANDKWLILVAEDEGEIVGYVSAAVNDYPPVFVEKRYGLIQDMGIRGDRRRRGAGSAMLDAVYAWFREREIWNVEIYAAHHNEVAQNFWRKQGFRDVMDRMHLKLD